MKRKIISIDEEKCNGCGLCVSACHEGALVMINGKARLISDSYCDGLGDCLPACPTDAIKIIEREADPFDEELVMATMKKRQEEQAAAQTTTKPAFTGCPGTMARMLNKNKPVEKPASPSASSPHIAGRAPSELQQWPCQIKLVPVNAPYFNNAHLLIAADCTAFASANVHSAFMKGKITIIGCPKLDEGDYADKLGAILAANNIRSITVLRMEVPCCAGLVAATQRAMANSGKIVPWQVVTISTEGDVINE